MSGRSIAGALLVCSLSACVLAASASGSSRRAAGQVLPVPQGFVGMVVDEPVWPDPFIKLPPQLDGMVGAGVQSIRAVFNWSQAQPYPNWRSVPNSERSEFTDAGGVPTNFTWTDALVKGAAARGLTVLPTVLEAPAWDGITAPGALDRIPRSNAPYAAFVKALVKRYGPRGTLWSGVPASQRQPITMWQIWNEPDLQQFWPIQPFAPRYVALLRAARKAIKSVDPSATIVLGGLTDYSWSDLNQIYAVHGAARLFDVVALHPYTRYPRGVLTILSFVRNVMNHHGDRAKPLMADEISWPSSVGKTNHDTGYDFATTEAGQADNIARVLPMLARARSALNLLGFYYYDWAGLERPNALAFEFAGLFRLSDGTFQPKPAYAAFRRGALSLEGCRSKGRSAADCVR